MTNATFHNFTDKPFTGYWNGKPKTFKAGEKLYMPAYLAEHFAKHLTNQVLIETGKEAYTSPKNPGTVMQFMDVFKKAFVPDVASEGMSELDNEIAGTIREPSMNIEVDKVKHVNDGPAEALKKNNESEKIDSDKKAQIINTPFGDDDEEFDIDGDNK